MGWTYDLTRLHAQVKAVLPGTMFGIDLQIWSHPRRDGSDDLSAEVAIWDSETHQRFTAPTPEAALALLRAHYAMLELKPEDLGIVAMPEAS